MVDRVTAFFDDAIVARGSRDAVTRRIEQGWPNDQGQVRVFDDATGKPVDLNLWDAAGDAPPAEPRPRGRPRLGVQAREVTLLPRQWQWLADQPGGASATLRRLVDAARKSPPPNGDAARDAVYRFVTAMAGDRPGYEEALRALYRGETERFCACIAPWPADISNYAEQLLGGASVQPG